MHIDWHIRIYWNRWNHFDYIIQMQSQHELLGVMLNELLDA